ncbi:MAG: GFA family protein [Pikeienuella sp.]
MTGQCLCGAVRIGLPERVSTVEACHCGMCRTLCGGGPMFALHLPGGTCPEIEGAENLTVYRSSDWAERAFCARCGTPVWYRFIAGDFHSLAAGLFEPEGLRLAKQIFIEAKPELYDLANDTPTLTEAEVIADFAAIQAKTQGSAP